MPRNSLLAAILTFFATLFALVVIVLGLFAWSSDSLFGSLVVGALVAWLMRGKVKNG
ncbi:MAG: hypothetical protein OXE80_05810 [Gammaproteobacteria bacterium]|nr:hypothetical protein [Gammaproteobacteria bacterium]